MSALRIEFARIDPKDARQFLRVLGTRYGLSPVPPGDRRFGDIEEACEFALGQATRLPKWTQRLRHPRSVRLVVCVDKYQPGMHNGRSDRGEADTSPGQDRTSSKEASHGTA